MQGKEPLLHTGWQEDKNLGKMVIAEYLKDKLAKNNYKRALVFG